MKPVNKKSISKLSLVFLVIFSAIFTFHFISIHAEPGVSVIASDPVIKGDLWSKKVIVSSDSSYHVYNVSVSIDIIENLKHLQLYRYVTQDMELRVTDDPSYDFQVLDIDNNGKYDTASWIIPELSEVSFSVEGQLSELESIEEGTATVFGDDFIRPMSPGPDDITGVSCTGSGWIDCFSGGNICYDDSDCAPKTVGSCDFTSKCPELSHAHNVSNTCGYSYDDSSCEGAFSCSMLNGYGHCKNSIGCSASGNCNYDCDEHWYNFDGTKSNGCESGCSNAHCYHPFTHSMEDGSPVNPEYAYDNNLSDSTTAGIIYSTASGVSTDNESVIYYFDFPEEFSEANLTYLYGVDVFWIDGTSMAHAYVKVWDYTNSEWDTLNSTIKDIPFGNYSISLNSSYFNSTGHAEVMFLATTARLSGTDPYTNITLYDVYIGNTTGEAPPPDNPPKYSLNSTNSTVSGTPVEHRLKWTDNIGLSYAIFSFDNCTGTLKNITNTSLSGSTDWSNFTVTINSTVGCTIRWCVYANDTNDNWNGTSCGDPFTFNTANFVEITLSKALLDGITFDTVIPNTVGNPARNNSHPETRYNVTVGSSSTQNLDFYVKLNESFETGIYINESSSTTSASSGFTMNTTVNATWSTLGNSTSNCTNLAVGNSCWMRLYFDVGNVPSGYKQREYTICGVMNGNNPSICG